MKSEPIVQSATALQRARLVSLGAEGKFTETTELAPNSPYSASKTGADLLVTSCPACVIHLSYGVRKHGLPVEVRHISEVVAKIGAATARARR